MTTYTRPLGGGTPTTGQVVKAVHVNDPIDQIYDTILAGGITADQIAAGAVDTSELATAAVTAAKMDGTLPDASAMATSAAPTTDAQLANKKYVDDQIPAANELVKAWVSFDGRNGTINGTGFNVTSVVRTATGRYTITWTTSFADDDYAIAGFTADASNGAGVVCNVFNDTPLAAGTALIETVRADNDVFADYNLVTVIAFGDQ